MLQLESDISFKQSDYLSNDKNKTQLIKGLLYVIKKKGHHVTFSKDDADKTIFQLPWNLQKMVFILLL